MTRSVAVFVAVPVAVPVALVFTICLALLACGERKHQPAPQPAPEATPAPTADVAGHAPDDVNIAKARERGRKQGFEWVDWSAEAFERARAENRFILLHCAAVWCHWCHVMEETTYLDPEVGRILRERFVTIRVDIDSRPDIEERYEAWGWPATILFSPAAEELGKYRGYIRPDDMREILTGVERAAVVAKDDALEPGKRSAAVAALPWIGQRTTMDLDAQYDREQGGWGFRFKVPFGENASFELRRAAREDDAARRRALFSLRQFARIIDPVWGGIYQYSTDGDWDHAHFEKLMIFQAPNLEAYARAYALTGDEDMLIHAKSIAGYVQAFLTSPEGTFYVTQDADVGTHDKTQAFVNGHDYYRLDDAARRQLGIPWVDDHVYAYENGLMIAALVSLAAAMGDAGAEHLARARRAADAILVSHVDARGVVAHDPASASSVRYLADAAGFGLALTRLAAATGEARYRDAAKRIAAVMIETLRDPDNAAFFAHTPDPAAAGVFAARRHAFVYNVMAARFLTALAALANEPALRAQALDTLAAVSTPGAIEGEGRMLGAYLMALDEAGVYPW